MRTEIEVGLCQILCQSDPDIHRPFLPDSAIRGGALLDQKAIDLYGFTPCGDVAEWLKAAVC
jgi:hypothetical protein